MKKISLKHINFHTVVIALLLFYFSFNYLPSAYSNIALIVAAGIFLIGVFSKNIKLNWSKQYVFYYLLMTIPLLLTLISIANSNTMEPGWHYIKLRLPVLFIPFIFLNSFESKEQLMKSVPIFLGFSLFALFVTIYRLIEIDPVSFYLLNTDCTPQATIIQHPYFGILQLVAFVFTLEYLRSIKSNKGIYYVLLLLFTLGVVVSTSRICYILYAIILTIYLIKFISRKKTIFILIVMVAGLTMVIATSEAIQYKFSRSINLETSPRLRLWNNAYMVLKNSDTPIIGVGIGDYYKEKGDPYWLRGYVNKLNEKNQYKGLYGFNPHNQYLEFILLNGVFGLLFLIMMGYLVFITFKRNEFLSLSLILVVALFTLTESTLNRQYGVVLYSFLLSIILSLNHIKNKHIANL